MALEVKRSTVPGRRPGAARELGGLPIAGLLPGAALPRPRRDSLGGDPWREGAPPGAPGAFPESLGAAVAWEEWPVSDLLLPRLYAPSTGRQ